MYLKPFVRSLSAVGCRIKRALDTELHLRIHHALVQGIHVLPLVLLLVLLHEANATAVLRLEPLGILVSVKTLALYCLIHLLLQHAKVAVGDGLLQLGILIWVV